MCCRDCQRELKAFVTEELSCQKLLSVVLRDATKNRSLTTRCGANDLPSRFPRSDSNRLENHAPRTVHSGLHKIAFTQLRLCEDLRRKRHHGTVADLTHVNHCHVRTCRIACIYSSHCSQVFHAYGG